ncbi:MAG: hypothetical protein ACR2JW_02965 [Thermomicrobiales bacterium]
MFAWEDFLTLANDIKGRSEEQYKRTAISRAYYAAYCSARDWYVNEWGAIPKDPNKSRQGSHEAVWDAYQSPRHAGDKRYSKIGARGDSLKRLRVWADYYLPFPTKLDVQVTIALSTAKNLIDDLKKM